MIPGTYSPRITQDLRIAVGRKGDKGYPEKLDHFILTRWNAGAKRYVEDAEATAALRAELGTDEKITRIPICVLGNLTTVPDATGRGGERLEVPDNILWQRMAYYQGSRAVCSCGDFRIKSQTEATADALDWPLDPDARHSWCGEYTRRRYQDGRLAREEHDFCNPHTCPFATGEGNQKNKGVPLCKPQVMFNVHLPWLPKLGTMAKFVTTSWQSAASLRGTLLTIGAMNVGHLLMVPLWLCVEIKRVSNEGYTGPVVHVEFDGGQMELSRATVKVKRQLAGFDAQLAALEPGAMKALDSGEEGRAWSGEFSHETMEDDPGEAFGGTDEVLTELATAAGVSDGELTARKAELDDGGEGTDLLIDQLGTEAKAQREAQRLPIPEEEDVQDAEYEEPVAEVVDGGIEKGSEDDAFADDETEEE